jgi:hypothetical protein
MAIAYIHPATGDRVAKEAWRWLAIYTDGSTLAQFEIKDGAAIFHRFAEIDTARLVILRMENDNYNSVDILVPAGAKPVHFYKVNKMTHTQTSNTGEQFSWKEDVKWYVAGYELNGVKQVAAITDSNRVIMTNDPDGLVVHSKGAY